jgi:hypothetical protein
VVVYSSDDLRALTERVREYCTARASTLIE